MSRTLSRIAFATSLTAVLAACGYPAARGPQITPEAPIAVGSAAEEAGFRNFIVSFRPRAIASGISPATYDNAMATARFNAEVIRLDRRQAEFSKPVWEYLDGAVSENRVNTGRQMAARYASTLAAIEARYGVPREIVLAVWGMESNFGANRGKTHIVSALTTLAFEGRRGSFFQEQLIAALRILQAGDVSPQGMVGSWAGAMGHTQFMPTSFLGYAVDFNGDGRRDIWSDDPTDSLASTASYLARSGWGRGGPAVVEVQLPSGFNYGATGKGTTRANAAWAAQGVQRIGGGGLPGGSGSILAPAGARGPAFLITPNFRAILRYNASDSYALGVSYLAERIAGRSGIQGGWPRGDAPLSNAQKAEIQRLLNARGYNAGEPDGKLGTQSIEAIRAFQRQAGVNPDGWATPALLALLRR